MTQPLGAPAFVTEQAVRDYMGLNAPGTDSKYSAATIHSNILAASWRLERVCSRLFGNRTGLTLTFSTDGRAAMVIPGLRTATSVTLQGAALVADTTYWLLPDSQQTGLSTGIQFRAFQGPGTANWWLHNPEWFDRNLDSPYYPGINGSLPNDLVIVGDWGYLDADMPEPVLGATKALAAFLTMRPDALLSGARTTPEGNVFDLSNWPIEVQSFVAEWRVGEAAVLV